MNIGLITISETVNPLCPCSLVVESSSKFFGTTIITQITIDNQKTLFYELQSIDENILHQSDNEIVKLLCNSKKINFQQNCSLLESAIKFILKSERLNESML